MPNPLQSTIVRVIFYVLSPVLAALPALFAGVVVVNPDAGTVTIDIDALVASVVAALGVSGGIFARWGKR